MVTTTGHGTRTRQMLNKVPEVTVYFWIIKILCTTVGESFADYVNETLGFGLTNTTLLFSAALAVALVAQFRLDRYVPGTYWLAVVLISVVGPYANVLKVRPPLVFSQNDVDRYLTEFEHVVAGL